MGADQSFRPASTAAPAAEHTNAATTGPRDKALQANTAGGGGNAYAATLKPPGQEPTAKPGAGEKTPGEPGKLDWVGAVLGSKHMRTMLGPSGKGVEWDDSEKGANRMEVDIWGKDEVRVPKLRISSLNTAGASAKDVHADTIKVNEKDKTKDGKLAAEITVAQASARDVVVASPEMQAAGIEVAGVKVRREFDGKRAVADVFSAPGPTSVEVNSATVKGLKAGGVGLESATANGIVATTDGTTHKLNAASASGTGLDVGGVKAASLGGTDLRAQNGPNGSAVSLASGHAENVAAGDMALGSLQTNGFAATHGADGMHASLAGATAKGASFGGTSLGEIGATNLTMAKNADILTAGAGQVRGKDISAGGGTVASAELNGVGLTHGGGATELRAQNATTTGVQMGGTSAASATMQAPTLSRKDGVTTLGAASLSAGSVKSGPTAVQNVGITAPTATFGLNGVSGGAASVEASNITGPASAKKIVANNVAGAHSAGVTTASVQNAQMDGVAAGGFTAGTVGVTGGSLHDDAAGTSFGATGANVNGLSGHGMSVRGAKLSDANLKVPAAGGVNLTAGGASVDQLRAGSTSVGAMDAAGLSVSNKGGNTTAKAKKLGLNNVNAAGTTFASGHASGASVSVGGGKVDIGADAAGVTGLAGDGFTVGEMSTTGAHVAHDEKGSRAQAATVSGKKVSGGGVNVAGVSAKGVDFVQDDTSTRVGVDSGSLSGVKAGNVGVAGLDVTGAKVKVGGGNTSVNAAAASATGIKTPQVTAGGAKATKLAVNHSSTGTAVTAATLGADKLHAGGLDAGHLQANGLDAKVTPGAKGNEVDANATGITGSGVAFVDGTTKAKAAKLSAGATNVKSGPKGTSATTAGLTASGVSVNTAGGVAPAEANDMADLSNLSVKGTVGLKPGQVRTGGKGDKPMIQQAANLVDNAQLSGSVPLKARTQGSGTSRVTTKEGTTAYVEVQVSGGKLVPSGSKASFSKPLDTWAWTSVPGVYLTPEGKLYASVNGMFDMNLSDDVNKALGGSGDKLPLGVSALAAHSGTASPGGGPVVSATVGQGPGANVASVSKDGDRSLTVNFSKLLLDALGMQSGDTKVDVKSVRAQDAGMAQDKKSTTITAGSVTTGRATISQ